MQEIEVKLPVGDADDARARLGRAGAVARTPRQFEDNRLYDDASRTLKGRREVLRLRSVGDANVVTFKKPLAVDYEDGRYKVRVEHETTVGNAAEMDEVFRGLGLRPVWRYQKFRQSYVLGEVHVELDETPIGVYIELEGAPDAIDAAAGALGFGPDDYVTKTYRQLHEEHAGHADPGDLVFPPPA